MPPVSESFPKQVAAPERSLVQRMEALQSANDIRSRRAQLKRDLKAGRTPIHELLLDPPDYVQTAKVFDLLLAVPKYGRVKVNKILGQCRISPSKTLGGLSERQRAELVALVRRRCRRGEGPGEPVAGGANSRAGARGLGDDSRTAPGRAQRRRLPLPRRRRVRSAGR